MNEALSLTTATVQDIHLELIRRSSFNEFDGAKVYAFLISHRELWSAVIVDRLSEVDSEGGLGNSSLIKLRDLPDNIWNTDTLLVMTPSQESADKLASLIQASDLSPDNVVVATEEEACNALGAWNTTGGNAGVLSAWWD